MSLATCVTTRAGSCGPSLGGYRRETFSPRSHFESFPLLSTFVTTRVLFTLQSRTSYTALFLALTPRLCILLCESLSNISEVFTGLSFALSEVLFSYKVYPLLCLTFLLHLYCIETSVTSCWATPPFSWMKTLLNSPRCDVS